MPTSSIPRIPRIACVVAARPNLMKVAPVLRAIKQADYQAETMPVSYTHLTLPTIYSV